MHWDKSGWVDVSNKRILLVDDEKDITNLLEEVLHKEGFNKIMKACNGTDAVALCRQHAPDAIILDIMLPDMDGMEVCKRIREFSFSPVLFLSSRNDELDKILGLMSGGDDYITKPFSPREVVFRVKAQLRRIQYNQSIREDIQTEMLHINDLSIDLEGSIVYKDGKELELTAREFELLVFLAQNPNRIISKERLYEQVWGEYSAICDNTIMVHIRHLREKLEEDASSPAVLVTVKGLGYKLVKRDK